MVCWLIWSIVVILTFFAVCMTFFPRLEFTGNVLYHTQLKSESWSVRNWICFCCSSINVLNDAPMLTFCNGGITSQLQDNPLSDLPDADEELATVSESQWWILLCIMVPELNNLNSGKIMISEVFLGSYRWYLSDVQKVSLIPF